MIWMDIVFNRQWGLFNIDIYSLHSRRIDCVTTVNMSTNQSNYFTKYLRPTKTGHRRRRPWMPIHPGFNQLGMGHDEPHITEWSRILWSMAETGLVPLKRNDLSRLVTNQMNGHNENKGMNEEVNDRISHNLGGVAQARIPNWHAARSNQTNHRRKKPNRMPTHSTSDENEEGNNNVKKKQSPSLPWFLNLVGPPGDTPNSLSLHEWTELNGFMNWSNFYLSIDWKKVLRAKMVETECRDRWAHQVYKAFREFKESMEVLEPKVFKVHREYKGRKVRQVYQAFKVTYWYLVC